MNIIIGNAWPYANGPLHLGRIAVLLPGDILARYHRMMGDEVIFLSGTDCHGTPVTIKAKEEGIMPIQAVKKYHAEFQKCFKLLGFSFDIFEKTHSKFHEEKVKEFILELYNKGYIYEKNVEQAYCEKCNEYLADKYIVGKCPHCGEEATGDDCENCNGEFEINELLDIRCKICNSRLILKETKHLFFALSKFEEDVKRVYENQDGWRENAKKILKRYLDEGLRDRTVTRDFNWGVDVPLDGYEDKKIFVWIEAVMGYLTASMKCLKERGEDYRDYWEGEDSRIYFIHGKDNIPFHTVIFPAILSGLGIKNPNLRLISGEHLKLEGKPFSTVKNWAIWADYVCKRYNVDSFRYYLVLNSPEDKDTDFTWREYINIHNSDLVNELSNFVNKVLSFSRKNYANRIPKGNIEENLKNEILNLYFYIGDNIEEGHFKESLNEIMALCKKGNKYFDNNKVWDLLSLNPSKCKDVIYNCIQIIVNLSNLLYPFMPNTCKKIKQSLDLKDGIWSFIEKKEGIIRECDILFTKIDKKRASEEVARLKENKI